MKTKISIILLLFTGVLLASSPFYGVQTHFGQYRRADMDSSSVEAQLDLIGEAGIDMIRDECLWSDVETDSGIYVIPPEVDSYVRSALSRDIDVYMILNYNNTFYAASNGSGVTTEANRVAYANYCQAVVGHFSPLGVKHFEIWNEPNHGVLFWTPQPNANDYTALLQTAYDSIKAIDTSVTVIGCATSPAIGNPAPYIEGLDFIRDVFAAGGGNYMDAVSFHLYQVAYRPENELIAYMNNVISYVGDKPIYLSEYGYPTHSAWPNISLEKQARYILRMFLRGRLEDQLKGMIYYDLKNDGTISEEPEHNFGILEFNRSPKPAYDALKALLTGLTDGSPPDDWEYASGVYRLFYNNGLNILWSYSGTNEIFHMQDNTDYGFPTNYYRILDMFGNTLEYHISARDSIRLTVSENPIYCIHGGSHQIDEFVFSDKTFLLYPGESVSFRYSSQDAEGVPVHIDPSAITWTMVGTNGTLNSNTFTAESMGQASVIGEIQGYSDTIRITVLEDPGYYTAESFSDTSGFTLESTKLNMDASFLGTAGGDQWDALSLDYEYSGSSATAYLYKDILINHLADSISLDFKTDDKEYEFRIYCKDANGVSYTLGLRPKPTDWVNSWKTLRGPLNIDESATPPVMIEKIYIKFKPGETMQSEPYTGSVMFDNLRLKKGDAVGLIDEEHLPESIILNQNYPNPFNSNTRIQFDLATPGDIDLTIYDLRGNLIRTLLDSYLDAGNHHIDLKLQNVPSGVYIYRLVSDKTSISKKFVYMK